MEHYFALHSGSFHNLPSMFSIPSQIDQFIQGEALLEKYEKERREQKLGRPKGEPKPKPMPRAVADQLRRDKLTAIYRELLLGGDKTSKDIADAIGRRTPAVMDKLNALKKEGVVAIVDRLPSNATVWRWIGD